MSFCDLARIHEFAISTYFFWIYKFESFIKLNTIIRITIPKGNAATILKDCKFDIELSENTNAMGECTT